MSIITPQIIASQAGHWYAQDGSPCYEVPSKSKPGEMRPTTLRDARALNLVPSVTTIIRQAAQPGLEKWKQQQLLHAALTLPRHDGESEDDYASRVIEDAAEQGRSAREKGTEIHAAIERFFDGIDPSPEMKPFVMAAFNAVTDKLDNPEWQAEKSFACSLGYGGKLDLHGMSLGQPFIVDFKTKADWSDKDAGKLAYDEHGMQLVAYAHGLSMATPRLFNVFIATDSPGKYHVHEWECDEFERLWRMFVSLLSYWQQMNRFFS